MATNYGLNDSLEYYEYEFDSSDTKNTPDTNYSTLDWPLFTTGRPLNNVAAIKILEVQIPFSFYIVVSPYNTFQLFEIFNSQLNTVTIPPGNYNGTTLSQALEIALNAASSVVGAGYVVTYSTTTSKFTISTDDALIAPDGFQLIFGLAGNDGYTNPRLVLGFNAGVNATGSLVGGVRSVFAPNIAQITGPNYLYINSRKMGQQIKLYLPEGAENGGELSPQMCKVPINVNPGGVIFWQTADAQKWFDLENLMNFGQIDFYCTLGPTNQIIKFNGSSFSLKIGVLVNRLVHNDVQAGLQHQGRVSKRMRY